ncbi:MAG: hypothetical protein M1826_000890 [Phylliscum demangeonii]|nr:MAG: hypothetical protein M1826_000890 [Phylliscum demangeonii]
MSETPSDTSSGVPESRVLIIMTGGTIGMKRSELGYIPARGFLEAALAPRPSFNDNSKPDPIAVVVGQHADHEDEDREEDGEDDDDDDDNDNNNDRTRNRTKQTTMLPSLRTPVSAYDRQVRYTVLEFEELVDSSSIDAHGWAEIAVAIWRNYQLFDAFVVLHGTDSLAYTSAALSFMLQNLGKAVVLTGAQVPMTDLQTDATDNLLGALIVAGHFMIPEVCLFFHHRLLRGNRATKVSSSDFDAFASPNHPPLAVITSMKTHVAWPLIHRPTSLNLFAIQTNLETSHVACLRIFPGIQPAMLAGVLGLEGLRGLVLETFGTGNAPGGTDSAMIKIVADAVRRGIVVVNVTQCLSGSVGLRYAPANALAHAGVVFGGDLTSEAALTKLSYLLALPDLTPSDVARQMSISLRGELSEQSETIFQHPALPSQRPSRSPATTTTPTNLTALGYAIARGDLTHVRELVRGGLLHEADASGNTPLHLAATGPNLAVLRDFLLQGASVHVRNGAGRTPLFLAARAARLENVRLLRRSGAHLHASEMARAWLLLQSSASNAPVWAAAGLARARERGAGGGGGGGGGGAGGGAGGGESGLAGGGA